MEFDLVQEIAKQIPSGIVTQFHWNGESLLHPRFGECVSLFKHTLRCMDTNAKLLMEKADEIIGNLDTITISVIENDPEGDEQYDNIIRFLDKKGCQKPRLVYRLLGSVESGKYERLGGTVSRRILHAPEGSHHYRKTPTIPEIGICLDLLTHLAIDRFGNVSVCVRFDPHQHGVIGNITHKSLEELWNGEVRRYYLDCHIKGHREYLLLCSKCDYWGVPRGD